MIGGRGVIVADGSAQAHLPSLASRLARRFSDLQPLHAGPYGTVYSARDLEASGARRAIRVGLAEVDPATTMPPAWLVRLRRLAELACTVSHAHVARGFDLAWFDGLPVLSMELAGPVSLTQYIGAHQPVPWPRLLTVLRELATALDAMHGAQIVHGNLCPSRVLLDATGQIKVVGMLLRTDERPPEAALRPAYVGEPRYMPPEQHFGPAHPAMDVFAVGTLTYELITRASRAWSVGRLLAIEPPLLPVGKPLRADVPADVTEVLRQALRTDPASRFPTVGAFVDALEASATARGRPPSRGQPTPPWTMGHVLRLAAMLALLLVVVLLLLS